MKKILWFFAVIGLLWGCASIKNKKDVSHFKLQTIPVLKNYDEDLSLKIEQFPDSQVQVTNDVNQEINLSTKFASGITLYRITFEKEATQYQDDFYKEEIKGKNVVCIVSGSNNDITRTEEIKERSLVYEGLKHYFMIQFPQRPGALKAFVNQVLGPEDDITYFQFSKKNSRESGPVVVGIELKHKEDFDGICNRLKELHFTYEYLNNNPTLFGLLVG